MCFVSDFFRRSARLELGEIGRQRDFLCVKPALIACLILVGSLPSLQGICKTVDTVLHRGNLITEMCDKGFPRFRCVGSCSSVRGVIADHLIEPVKCGQGSSRTESDALRSPCFHLAFGKW